MSKNSNIIALTMGDPSGVGTEIAIRAKIKKIKKPNFFIIHDPDFVKKIIKRIICKKIWGKYHLGPCFWDALN